MKHAVIVAILSALIAAHPLAKSNINGQLENAPAPKAVEGHGHGHHHHHHHHDTSSFDDVRLALDGGWYSFQFGKEGTFVDTEFCFFLHGPAILKVTDYFCAGDRFGVKDNGVWLGPTSYVPFDNCKTNTTNPSEAYHSDAFSHAAFNLAPGPHRITLKVLLSPYNGGSGAIRLDSVYNRCPTLKHGLALINTHVPFCEAHKVCESYDLQLAELDIFNFLDATDVAFQCAGPFSKSWVNSWSENDYGHACLALSTGVAAPGGNINIPDSCDLKLPVLCQERKNPCGEVKPCHRPRWEHPACPREDHCGRHRPCRPCGECRHDDWQCWTACSSEWSDSFDDLECQPHMPCWPHWCLQHGKCDLAKEAIAKRQVEERKQAQAKSEVKKELSKQEQLRIAAEAYKKRQQQQQAAAAGNEKKPEQQAGEKKPQQQPQQQQAAKPQEKKPEEKKPVAQGKIVEKKQ